MLPRLFPILLLATLALACSSYGSKTATPTASVVVVQVTPASQTATAPAPTTSPAASHLSLDSLKNATYTLNGQAMKLVNGAYTAPTPSVGAAPVQGLTFVDMPVAYGDLDGDGVEDAAVILIADGGGTGRFYQLAAVLNKGGQPAFADAVALGDRVIVRSLGTASGVVTAELTVAGPSDPLCCPNTPAVMRYKLTGGKLVLA